MVKVKLAIGFDLVSMVDACGWDLSEVMRHSKYSEHKFDTRLEAIAFCKGVDVVSWRTHDQVETCIEDEFEIISPASEEEVVQIEEYELTSRII